MLRTMANGKKVRREKSYYQNYSPFCRNMISPTYMLESEFTTKAIKRSKKWRSVKDLLFSVVSFLSVTFSCLCMLLLLFNGSLICNVQELEIQVRSICIYQILEIELKNNADILLLFRKIKNR